MDFDEIFRKCPKWDKEQVILGWILMIVQELSSLGGGLRSLSALFYLCSNAFISGVFQMFDKKPFNTSVSSIHLPFNIFEFQTLLYSALCNKQLLFPKKFNSQYLLNLPQPTYNKTSINIQHLQNIQKEPYIIIRLKCGTYC